MIVGGSLCLPNQKNWIFTRTRNRVTSYTTRILMLCKTLLVCLNPHLGLTLNAESSIVENLDMLRKTVYFLKMCLVFNMLQTEAYQNPGELKCSCFRNG